MKTWLKKYEWTSYAACADNDLHTAEYDDQFQLNPLFQQAKKVCSLCTVRPECIKWALREKACGVVVAGTYLPDPIYKKELKAAYSELQKSVMFEEKIRGEV